MAIISDKTGYESDMVSAEMDLESDLGIDSIKRVEILGAAQEALGIKVQDLDALGRTKTVGEVIAFLRRETEGAREVRADPHASPTRPAPPPAATPSMPPTAATARCTPDAVGVVMAIISDKTGYESDMVSAEMDLESDLGIDSIKRVEILGAAQEALRIKVRDLDALGRTKTVGEVITFLRLETEGAREACAEAATPYNTGPLAKVSEAATSVSKSVVSLSVLHV